MPTENPSDTKVSASGALPGPFRRMAPPRRGFRRWLLDNYRLVYFLDLVTAYASLMLYFASLVLLGKPTILSRIFLGIVFGAGFIAALPFVSRGSANPEAQFIRMLKTRRPKKTERVELVVLIVLWSLIALALTVALSRFRG